MNTIFKESLFKSNLLKAVLIVAILTLAICSVSFEAKAAPGITVTMDGKNVRFDQPPTIIQGRTLVPMRAIFEAMNMNVTWNPYSRTIYASNYEVEIISRIDSHTAEIGTDELGYIQIELDVPPKILNGRTMVPLRFIGQATGSNVSWNQGLQRVVITSNPYREFREYDGWTDVDGESLYWTYLGYDEFGSAEGYGRINYSNGETYVGDWLDDMRHGFGIADFADGEEYIGYWKYDMRNGYGTNIDAYGYELSGTWVNDEFIN